MEENTILDFNQEARTPKPTNNVLNVFCILGYIANGFWALVLLVMLLAGTAYLYEIIPQLNSLDERAIRIIYIVFIAMLLINILSIVGLVLAHKRNKSGVILYGISNGIWALLMMISLQPLNLFIGVISIVFIVVIALNYNK
jgi:hypothetical protein